MSMFARTALRRSTPVVSRPQVRNMSGHGTPEEMHGAFLLFPQRSPCAAREIIRPSAGAPFGS